MRNVNRPAEPFDCTLLSSLNAIRRAQVKLDQLTGMCTTASVLASQIELREALLVQISDIRHSLAKELKLTRIPEPRTMVIGVECPATP